MMSIFRASLRACVLGLAILAFLGECLQAQATEPAPYAVGLRMTQADAGMGSPFPVAIWYPATASVGATPPLSPGRFPLILLSHGSGGYELSHRDWAETLAAHGFIVVAPRHQGDSYDQPNGRGSDVQLIGRAWQAKAALDMALADPQFSPAIDPRRIGMLGFSAGGYTTLVMAGARPDLGRWRSHCLEHAEQDGELCPAAVWRRLPIVTRPGWALPDETRIKAAVVLAPLGVFFGRQELDAIHIPLLLYGARDDHFLFYDWNVGQVARSLPRPAPVRMVEGGHFVFLAPCDGDMLRRLPQICTDADGVDRAAIHRRIGEELVAFFTASL
jgi:predicted dienelactone hydrolase